MVRTTSAKRAAAGLRAARRGCRARGASAPRCRRRPSGRSPDRAAPGPTRTADCPARTAGEYGPIAFGALGARNCALLHAAMLTPALTTLPERRQRVQTRIRLMPPLMIALTVCRFGSNRRALTLFAWLCCRPTTGPFPQISHCFAIISRSVSLSGLPVDCPSTGKPQV